MTTSDPYAPGSVWWLLKDYGDGNGPVRKYFVLLTDGFAAGDTAVFATTTSRGYRYHGQSPSPCGVPAHAMYRIDGKLEACFPVDTYVQFDNLEEITLQTLTLRMASGDANFMQHLNDQRFRSILNCASSSRDVAGWVKADIKATLAALTPPKPPPAKARPPTAPPVFLSAEVMSLKMKIAGRCDPCRDEFAILLEITVADLSLILSGAKKPSADFTSKIDAGLDAAGPGCPCRAK